MPYRDSTGHQHFYLADPWGEPYGFIGAPHRVIHNLGSFDLFSAGADGVTAGNNGVTDGGMVHYGCSTDPLSQRAGDNRAYNGLDDDGDSIVDDRDEFGSEAMLNGDPDDDINNWHGSDRYGY